MKDLPRVSSFPINRNLNNSQETYKTNATFSEQKRNDNRNISSKINDIFRSSSYIYKCKLRIKTKDDIFEKTVIGKYNGYLLTVTGEKIKLEDILDVERI